MAASHDILDAIDSAAAGIDTTDPILTPNHNVVQQFQRLAVIDFEATCIQGETNFPNEIIEFPCVIINTST